MENDPARFRILLVEDDQRLADMVAEFLESSGFEVSTEHRGDVAVNAILRLRPDAVVLDVNLPGMSGFEVCQMVRSDYRGAIIMLTARGDEVDEILGLEFGADDYIAKPVKPRVLLARLRSHLRRSQASLDEAGSPIVVGPLVVDPARRLAEIDGRAIDLTTAEFDLLQLLADHAGHPLSRHEIYEHIHGMRYDSMDRSIDLRISRLRKKLGDDPARPKRIKSVRGVGYMLSVES